MLRVSGLDPQNILMEKLALGKYIFFQHFSHSTPPVSVCIHLPSSIVFSHLIHSFFFLRFDSSKDADDGVVSDRAGSFGALCSGETGRSPGIVFERPFKPLAFAVLDPVVDDPSSKRVSIAFSRAWVDLAVDRG